MGVVLWLPSNVTSESLLFSVHGFRMLSCQFVHSAEAPKSLFNHVRNFNRGIKVSSLWRVPHLNWLAHSIIKPCHRLFFSSFGHGISIISPLSTYKSLTILLEVCVAKHLTICLLLQLFFYIYKVFLIIPYLFIQLYRRGREPSMSCRREKTSPIPMALPSTPTLNLLRFCPFISPNKQRSNFLFSYYGNKKLKFRKVAAHLPG